MLIIHPPKHKDLSDTKEVMQIRHFLERSSVPEISVEDGSHLLVVINHREARIYRTELRDSVPESITPYDPDGTRRHLHNLHDDANGQPELKSFYEAIAQTLKDKDAEQILIFGSATGASSAMDYLVDELNQNHPDIAKRIVGAIVVNEQHLTEDQLLAQARAFYEAN